MWRPAFDELKVTAVMVDSATATNTYRRLSQSPNWIPFYDDGRAVLHVDDDGPGLDPDAAEKLRALGYLR